MPYDDLKQRYKEERKSKGIVIKGDYAGQTVVMSQRDLEYQSPYSDNLRFVGIPGGKDPLAFWVHLEDWNYREPSAYDVVTYLMEWYARESTQ